MSNDTESWQHASLKAKIAHCIDAHAIGPVLMTGFGPASTVLHDNDAEIVKEMESLYLSGLGLREHVASPPVRPTADFIGADNLAEWFGG